MPAPESRVEKQLPFYSSDSSTESLLPHPFTYRRRKTRVVPVGEVRIGGNNPIRIQSMVVADTLNTSAVVEETRQLVEAGCEIVRITAPTVHHAENLKNIRAALKAAGIHVPLVADIHFTPQAALIAADYVEKVRINPGNFADRKVFAVKEYTDAAYQEELERIRERFVPLVRKCKQNGIAMRIGTNHGSLSDRILNRYGDTALGMVESALEFVRICEDEGYPDVIFSMKASNTQVMVEAYRLLTAQMAASGMDYPLHLGVTEAGEGEDGRIKSAIGILTLLEDGIGDTIRVSLTEDSIHEIPVAQKIVRKFNSSVSSPSFLTSDFSVDEAKTALSWNPLESSRRPSETVKVGPIHVGGKHVVRVRVTLPFDLHSHFQKSLHAQIENLLRAERPPEIVCFKLQDDEGLLEAFLEYVPFFKKTFPALALGVCLADAAHLFPQVAPAVDLVSVAPSREKNREGYHAQAIELVRIANQLPVLLEWNLSDEWLPSFIKSSDPFLRATLLVQLAEWSVFEGLHRFGLCSAGSDFIYQNRFLINLLDRQQIPAAIHLQKTFFESASLKNELDEQLVLSSSGDLGALLLDGLGDSVEISLDHSKMPDSAGVGACTHLAYNILQGARQRVTKTEFIACPSCGRTLFDLQSTTAHIKSLTAHLKGVKIAIMGCIVNGPGEMADADFGYVGGGPKTIQLYVGKECVERNIPEKEAGARLVELIKKHGRWVDPPSIL